MRNGAIVAVIIPAFNEEPSIGKVIAAIPEWVDDVIVVDNGSTDSTAEVARDHGARVVPEPQRGYGSACLAGIAALDNPDVVVFLDGDFSDHPEEMHLLVDPIASDLADMVIGSRIIGKRAPGALTLQALFGNWLSCMLLRWLWSVSYTDLGPFRAIRHETLKRLAMRDRNYGWTVEMQVKAAQRGVRVCEVPVSYRKRVGRSKISGTVKGVLGAGTKILSTIFRAAIGPLPDNTSADHTDRLIIFTRYPEPGKTKTRLIPALGPTGATELHRKMANRTLGTAKDFSARRTVSIEIRYEGGNERLMAGWLGGELAIRNQSGGGLGTRMHDSLTDAFEEDAHKVVIVGTDCPGMSADILEKAFNQLVEHDLVLGPAEDGGYYLVGMKTPTPRIFAGITWGADDVLRKTLETAKELGISTALLDKLADVDRPEDLHVWEQETGESATDTSMPKISVIIPTYNEADCVGEAIAAARKAAGAEIIVVDAGSHDNSVKKAEEAGVRVIAAPRGRGSQMNAGAVAAKGDILLFLHADTILPDNYDEHVLGALTGPDVVGGAFRLGISSQKASLRWIEKLANWRSKRLQMPYGDQAIFVRADVFSAMGGLPLVPIMEDFEFVRRLRHLGKITLVPATVLTSPRRWLELGVLRTTLLNRAIITAYFLGVSIHRIAGWHRSEWESRPDPSPRTPGRN